MSKITIVGISGAGKTCYMIGMFSKMISGVDGFTLTSANDFQKLKRMIQRLGDKKLPVSERFPAPSDQVEKYTLSLKFALRELDDIEWIDYPGGNFSDVELNDPVNQEFCNHAINSDCLFLCVDGATFSEGTEEEIIEQFSIYQGGLELNNLLAKVSGDNNGKLPNICIIITKYDKVPAEKRERKFMYKIISKTFPTLFEKTQFNQRVVGICPVSLGKDLEANGNLLPFNIEKPILFSTFFKQLAVLETANQEIGVSKSEIGKFSGGKIKNWWNSAEIAAAKSKAELYSAVKGDLLKSLSKVKTSISDLPLYVNGDSMDWDRI